MAEIEIDISRHMRVAPALKDGLEDGMAEAGENLVKKGKSRAKGHVRGTDRMWRSKLYNSFRAEPGYGDFTGDARWTGSFENFAPHARVVEYGLTPGDPPAVQDIIDWVEYKLRPKSEEAQSRHIGNWDPQLQALAVHYGKGYVLTAFAVQEELRKNGYHGIGFMKAAETYLKQIGPMIVHRKVEKHMRKQLRKAGVT